ncbi:MAG TPA: hypothetical protein PKI05_15780, partial [Thermogutta sp.]|nr:hypothetical protein [Thermogutta sp.]
GMGTATFLLLSGVPFLVRDFLANSSPVISDDVTTGEFWEFTTFNGESYFRSGCYCRSLGLYSVAPATSPRCNGQFRGEK